MIEKQELHCHECDCFVQFELDMDLNGNHVLNCPNCGHEHCRVIRDGRITGDRWGQRNGPAIYITAGVTSTNTSTWDTSTCTDSLGGTFLYNSWMNTTVSGM